MELIRITSRQNETLKTVRALSEKKYRKQLGLFFTEGRKLFFEALEAGLVPKFTVLSEDAPEEMREGVCAALKPWDVRCLSVPASVYASVSAEDAPQGILAVFSVREVLENSKKFRPESPESGRYVILERVQDPGNAGTILRSAAAFGYTGVLAVSGADLFSPKAVRASMGALFHLEILVFPELSGALGEVRARGLHLYGTAPRAEISITGAAYAEPFGVILGNEGAGMSEEAMEACEKLFTIPMRGMESLNVAAACAVTLYESTRGRVNG